MSDQQDGAEKFALTLVALLVAAVVAGSMAFGVSRARPVKAASESSAPADAMAVSPVETLFFAVGDDQLPPEANDVLARMAVAARSNAGATIAVSGFHDASGDRTANQDLARRRAEQVRHALEANGVAPAQIILDKPTETTGGGDPAQARRVEMRLQ